MGKTRSWRKATLRCSRRHWLTPSALFHLAASSETAQRQTEQPKSPGVPSRPLDLTYDELMMNGVSVQLKLARRVTCLR
jgi:hypothetical protein